MNMNGRHWVVWGLMLIVAVMLLYVFSNASPRTAVEQLSYTSFRNYVENGGIASAEID
ncbi:MAG: ATP-dependent metallopeptidase FtsH/Yme1/Tma family protein, partial [Pseudomonadota bacterium]